MTLSPVLRYLVRYLALGYVLVLIIVPVGLILWRTFQPGVGRIHRPDHYARRRSRRCSCRW